MRMKTGLLLGGRVGGGHASECDITHYTVLPLRSLKLLYYFSATTFGYGITADVPNASTLKPNNDY